MQDYHKLMQSIAVINARDVSKIWEAIQECEAGGSPKHFVGSWHSSDGKVFSLETEIINSGGRMLRIDIGPDGKLMASIVFPEMD